LKAVELCGPLRLTSYKIAHRRNFIPRIWAAGRAPGPFLSLKISEFQNQDN
jgi:hypothetical protein